MIRQEGNYMKRIFALLCGVLLVGCGNGDTAPNKENHKQEVAQQETTQTDKEIEVTEKVEESIPQNANGEIEIQTEGFVQNMDKIFTDLDQYEGKTLTYEGLLIQTEEETNQHAVVRVYEVNHDDHSHSIYVGLETTYEGEWPEVNNWVQVKGTIERANDGGEDYPSLKIEELTVMPEQGELTVLN